MAWPASRVGYASWIRNFMVSMALACASTPTANAIMISTGLDTFVQFAAPNDFNGSEIVLEWDGEDPHQSGAQPNHGLLKFNLNLDAATPNGTLRQRILATPNLRARVRLNVVNPGDDANLYRMQTAFDDNTTWNSLGGGVQTSGAGQNAESISNASTSGSGSTGTIEVDVTSDLVAWANGAVNHGWAFLPTDWNGTEVTSFEGGAGSPVLIIEQVANLVTAGAAGSTWRYYDGIPSGDANYPTDSEGDAWYAADFDDGAWNSGTGQFGYGEGDETVVLDNGQGGGSCSGAAPCRITYLFRTTFEVTETADSVIVEIMLDDAMKLYLNDVEVLIDNLTNPVDAATLADSAVGGSGEDVWLTFSLDPADFVLGTNTLAVEVHNWDESSSDISFDLSLTAIIDSLQSIPEPGSGALLGLGLAVLASIRRGR